jgi:glutamate-1-semialdehyde 2,1-aminomutase
MDHVLPVGKVFQAGTLSGNPIATAAGAATLRILRDENPYPQLESTGRQLAEGLAAAASAAGIPHQLQRVGSMMTLFFRAGPVEGWQQASSCDTERFSRYFWGLMDRGVYMPCSQYEALFVSTAHDEDDIRQTIEAAADVLAALS